MGEGLNCFKSEIYQQEQREWLEKTNPPYVIILEEMAPGELGLNGRGTGSI